MVSATDFEGYETHLFEKGMQKESGNDYRRCAHANCVGGGWCDLEMESLKTCLACAQGTCIEYNIVWHSQKTYPEHKEEARVQKAEEAAAACAVAEAESVKYVEENCKACPNYSCGYRIEKRGGCDHMTCGRCWHQFCWICDVDYQEVHRVGNTAHKEDCEYNSNLLN